MALKVEIFGNDSAWHDVTQFLTYGSLTLRLNTFDFELIDLSPSAWFSGTTFAARTNLQGWSGIITVTEQYDPVNLRSGHQAIRCTVVNTTPSVYSVSGLTFSDVPVPSTDLYLLEDGSGTYLLEAGSFEDPGSYALEGGTYGYQDLHITTQTNYGDVTTSSIGHFRVFTPGLWPGTVFNLLSNNLLGGFTGIYYVTQTVITFEGANPPSAVYDVEFSVSSIADVPPTLQSWRLSG